MYALVVHRRAARYLGTLSQNQQVEMKRVLNEIRKSLGDFWDQAHGG